MKTMHIIRKISDITRRQTCWLLICAGLALILGWHAAVAQELSVVADTSNWQRLWGLRFALLALVALGFGIDFFRVRAIRRQKLILEQQVKERTAELEAQKAQLIRSEQELQRAKDAADAARKTAEVARKTAESARRASEEANQAKSEFLSNMSHELRTPLNGILGYVQILKANRRLDPFADVQDGLNIIAHSGNHLLRLINEVLDLSKIEARKLELDEQVVVLSELLRGIAGIMCVRAQQKGLTFTFELPPDLPQAIRVDEKRLSQVLFNLLGNAIKFTDEGSVTLEVKSEQLQVNNTKPHHSSLVTLHFSIFDTGIGIPETRLEDIFSPFQQISEHTRHREGAGLGLSVSRKLVELMGGELHVASVVGQGSTFGFTLTVPEVADWQPRPTLPARRIIGYRPLDEMNAHTLTVLIADDKWENRSVLVNFLTPLGFTIEEACDGQEALEKIVERQPDLILMDLVMPRLNGYEAIRNIRANPRIRQPKIIAVSANSSSVGRPPLSLIECDAFLEKPIQAPKLFAAIGQHAPLEWLYETPCADDDAGNSAEREIPTDAVIPPEQDTLRTLLELARMGDVIGLQEQARACEAKRPELLPFAGELRQLADAYLVDEMKTFLQSFLEGE